MNTQEYLRELPNFTGTSQYYRYIGKFLLTDGAKFVADSNQCYWLMDIIVSWQSEPKLKNEYFQSWKLDITTDRNSGIKSGTVVCTDGNYKKLCTQKIDQIFGMLDIQQIELFAEDSGEYMVIYLPSEY